jgi:hypothetical protein
VYPRIRIIGAAANENHYVTLMGLWPCQPSDIGVNTPIYDYPRDVKITLSPQAANLLSNPLTQFDSGFDGISPAADPTQSSVNFTCGLTINYVSSEDPLGTFAINGVGSLRVTATAPNATVWFGLVSAFTQPPPTIPKGWFTNHATTWPPSGDAGDWFPGETLQATSNKWFDPVNGWFFAEPYYFSAIAPVFVGNWFPSATQPPLTGNLGPFTVPASQPFNFSVYADYLTALNPSNAVMQIGFRWYYPDGTWREVYTQYQLTATLTRYSIPIADDSSLMNLNLANPPLEPVTFTQPTTMYPFVRFPYAQAADFLLNSAMLSPGPTIMPYFDISMFPGDSDYVWDSHHGTYYYKHRDVRTQRLETSLYRWIPMGASHTEVFGAGGSLAPLDPTGWTHPALVLRGTTTLLATAS